MPTSRRALPLRLRLLLLGASGLLPLMLVLAWGANHLVREQQLQAERSALELSRALGTAIEGEHRAITALLQHMSTSDELERADFRAFYSSARRTAQALGWTAVVLSDAEGRTMLRSNEIYGSSSAASMETPSLLRAMKSRQPVIGDLFDLPGVSGKHFAVRVPVVRSDQLVYVISAYVPATTMTQIVARQNIPEGNVASVFDAQLERVVRSRPPASGTVAPNRPSPGLETLIRSQRAEGAGRTQSLDGVENITGFTRLANSGWVVAVGNAVSQVNRTLLDLLPVLFLGLAASLGFSILLAWLLSRRVIEPVDTLEAAAHALGRGAPVNVPTLPIAELNPVAHALNEAAAERDRSAAQVADALHVAEEANRSKDQFLAMLGHELRNPLAPIANAVRIMALKGDEKTAQERQVIERQLVHVTRLVDDLLDVSRITSARLTIRREPVHIALMLRQLVDTLRPSLYHHRLSLDMDAGAQSAWVMGDETRLAQVFNNLLVNAVKFTPPEGEIAVRATRIDGELQVQVRDNGVGMTQQDLERVFDLFYQAPQSVDRARGGLGLGLPIVKSLVGMHGGSVHAASAGPGQGSTVTVHLPVCDAPSGADAVEMASRAAGSGHVLVVDDNEDAADTCAALLEMSGYTVRTSYSPAGAIEAVQTAPPQVAILDIGLPGISGYELARRLRAGGFTGSLVALTGYGQASDVAASRAAGFDAHLTKPVSPEALLDLVARLMAPAATNGS